MDQNVQHKARNLAAKAELLAYAELTDIHRIKLKYHIFVTSEGLVTSDF